MAKDEEGEQIVLATMDNDQAPSWFKMVYNKGNKKSKYSSPNSNYLTRYKVGLSKKAK